MSSSIVLMQFPISKKAKVANHSFFCLKLETYLRAANIDYTVQYFNRPPSTLKPKGKLPVLVIDGEMIPDSEFIIKSLKLKKGIDLDSKLDSIQLADSIAYKKMIEDHFNFIQAYFRWALDDNWEKTKDIFFKGLPAPLKLFVPELARKPVIKALWGQGLGRHSVKELLELTDNCLFALSEKLGEKDFFFGSEVSSLDCTAFGSLANLYRTELAPQMTELAQKYTNLKDFSDRLTRLYFPERN